MDYEHLARLFAEIGLWRAHVACGLPEAEQFPVAHAPQPGAERFQVQLVFAGKIVYDEPLNVPHARRETFRNFRVCFGKQ